MFSRESLQSWSNMLVNENQLIRIGPQVSSTHKSDYALFSGDWLLGTSPAARLASSCQGLFDFLYPTLTEIPATD